MKNTIFYALLTLVLILAGCANGKNNNAINSGPSDSNKLKIVLLIPGTLGDKSFFDAANKGLQKVKEELGAETKVIEMGADNTKYGNQRLIKLPHKAGISLFLEDHKLQSC